MLYTNHAIMSWATFETERRFKSWYSPPPKHAVLEYEWVRNNIDFKPTMKVVDAGCHHGYYSFVFFPAWIIAIDSDAKAIRIAKRNFRANNLLGVFINQEIDEHGIATFINHVDVYKMDIEGAEFKCLPSEIDRFPMCHTWIVEVHPPHGNPMDIVEMFRAREFELLKVDREKMVVREFETCNEHTTIIARRQL